MIRTLAAASAALCLAALPVAAQETMETADVETLTAELVGNTFQGDMGGGGYASYFGADGMYHDESGSGVYEITEEGVCYPETDFGCYQATIDGTSLEWSQDGESAGTGEILEGDALGFTTE